MYVGLFIIMGVFISLTIDQILVNDFEGLESRSTGEFQTLYRVCNEPNILPLANILHRFPEHAIVK